MRFRHGEAVFGCIFGTLLMLGAGSSAWAIEGSGKTVIQKIEERAAGVKKPVFIFDLDETIIDSTVRRYLSYQDAIEQICSNLVQPETRDSCDKARSVTVADFQVLPNRYDDRALFEGRGVAPSVYKQIFETTLPIYLSDRWIADSDSFIPGAGAFMRKIMSFKGEVFFASSRSLQDQRIGTLDSLYRLGLLKPGEEWKVSLKPNGEKSIAFKRRAFLEIGKWAEKNGGEVVGVFENEPENMNALVELFPSAVPVFVKGAYLKPEPVREEALQIRDFWF